MASYAREDFIVSGCNEHAYTYLTQWPDWPAPHLYVYGPQGSGKTHLAHIWQENSQAQYYKSCLPPMEDIPQPCVIEDIEVIGDMVGLLQRLNWWKEHSCPLLLTSCQMPQQLLYTLPDLTSRLQALPIITIDSPDELVFEGVASKLFADRQLRVSPEVVHYVQMRIDRSLISLQKVIVALDAQALTTKRTITLPFAREVLSSLDLENQI